MDRSIGRLLLEYLRVSPYGSLPQVLSLQ